MTKNTNKLFAVALVAVALFMATNLFSGKTSSYSKISSLTNFISKGMQIGFSANSQR